MNNILLQKTKDENIHKIMYKHSNYLKKISKTMKYFIYTSFVLSCVTSISQKTLLYATYIPGIDIDHVFWIVNPMQTGLTLITINIVYSYLNLIFSFIVFGIAQFRVLRYKISTLAIEEGCVQLQTELRAFTFKAQLEENLLSDNILNCIKTFIHIKRYKKQH